MNWKVLSEANWMWISIVCFTYYWFHLSVPSNVFKIVFRVCICYCQENWPNTSYLAIIGIRTLRMFFKTWDLSIITSYQREIYQNFYILVKSLHNFYNVFLPFVGYSQWRTQKNWSIKIRKQEARKTKRRINDRVQETIKINWCFKKAEGKSTLKNKVKP